MGLYICKIPRKVFVEVGLPMSGSVILGGPCACCFGMVSVLELQIVYIL